LVEHAAPAGERHENGRTVHPPVDPLAATRQRRRLLAGVPGDAHEGDAQRSDAPPREGVACVRGTARRGTIAAGNRGSERMNAAAQLTFVWASYAVSAAVFVGLIAWLLIEGRRQAAQLEALERRGVRRRSAEPG